MARVMIRKQDLLYPELSYEIMGCAYDVHNELGSGLRESDYQKAMAIALAKKAIAFKEQVYRPVKFQGKTIRRGFIDFVVDEKIVLEIKKGNYFGRANINQLVEYLKSSKLKLGMLINFGTEAVRSKRIANLSK